MKIIDAEPQLIKDILDEITVIAIKENSIQKVQIGRHPTLGKLVVIESKKGEGFIVEMDE